MKKKWIIWVIVFLVTAGVYCAPDATDSHTQATVEPMSLSDFDLDSNSLKNCIIENVPRDVNEPLVLEAGQSYVNLATGEYCIYEGPF